MPITVLSIADGAEGTATLVTFWPTDRSDGVVVEDLDGDTLQDFEYWVSAYLIEGDQEETPVGKTHPSWLTGTVTQQIVNGKQQGVVEFALDESGLADDVASVRIGMSISDGAATTTASVLYTRQTTPVGKVAVFPGAATGEVFFATDTSGEVTPDPLVKVEKIVGTDDELAAAKGTAGSTFETVFNNWGRFSHDGVDDNVDPVPPSNVPLSDLFVYDAATDTITQNTNTAPAVGFVSNEVYDTYTHKAQVSSTDPDDDSIGLVIAFATLDNDVDERTLSVILVMSKDNVAGNAPTFQVVYNYRQDTEVVLYENNAWITSDPGGWNNAGIGAPIEVIRDGDSVTVKAGQFGTSVIDEASAITFNLFDRPETADFRGPQRYGYITWSQADSTFGTRSFSGALDVIYDMSVDPPVVWTFVNGAWGIDNTLDFYDELGYGRIVFNRTTRKTFFVATLAERVGGVGVHKVASQHYDLGDLIVGPLSAATTETIAGALMRRNVRFLRAQIEARVAGATDLTINLAKNDIVVASVVLPATTSAVENVIDVTFAEGDRLKIERVNGDPAEDVYYLFAGEVV